MTPRKPPTKVEIDLPVVEPDHMPIVCVDDLKLPKLVLEALGRALADGTSDSGGCKARRMEPPPEAAIVHLPKSDLLYCSFGLPRPGIPYRPAEQWWPAARLQRASLNGWAYLSATRLYEVPSVAIFFELEATFGRIAPRPTAAANYDHVSKKQTGIEKVEIEAMVEIDNAGTDSASKSEIIRYCGAWIPFRRISLIEARRVERERLNHPNVNPL